MSYGCISRVCMRTARIGDTVFQLLANSLRKHGVKCRVKRAALVVGADWQTIDKIMAELGLTRMKGKAAKNVITRQPNAKRVLVYTFTHNELRYRVDLHPEVAL